MLSHPFVLAYLASCNALVIKSKLKPLIQLRFHFTVLGVPQVLRHGHPTFGGTTAPKTVGWVTKQPWGKEHVFFVMHGSKRRLARRWAGLPPDGRIHTRWNRT